MIMTMRCTSRYGVNIRSYQTTNSNIRGILRLGEEILVDNVEKVGSWYKFMWPASDYNSFCYVHEDYVEFVDMPSVTITPNMIAAATHIRDSLEDIGNTITSLISTLNDIFNAPS